MEEKSLEKELEANVIATDVLTSTTFRAIHLYAHQRPEGQKFWGLFFGTGIMFLEASLLHSALRGELGVRNGQSSLVSI